MSHSCALLGYSDGFIISSTRVAFATSQRVISRSAATSDNMLWAVLGCGMRTQVSYSISVLSRCEREELAGITRSTDEFNMLHQLDVFQSSEKIAMLVLAAALTPLRGVTTRPSGGAGHAHTIIQTTLFRYGYVRLMDGLGNVVRLHTDRTISPKSSIRRLLRCPDTETPYIKSGRCAA
jgi:hypothetical protein